jgi:hypothetical protein
MRKVLLILVASYALSYGQFSYQLEFVDKPREELYLIDGDSAGLITASIKLGYVLDDTKYPEYCTPPPPGFGVGLWCIDDTSDPPCSSLAFLGFYQINGENGQRIAWGEGEIKHMNPNPDSIAYQGAFNLGWNYFDLAIRSISTGDYIIKLYKNEYEWIADPAEIVGRKTKWYLKDENVVTRIAAEENVSVKNNYPDHVSLVNLYCIDTNNKSPVYSGGAIAADSDYQFIFYVRTYGKENPLPDTISGEITPLGLDSITADFVRWPPGDGKCIDGRGPRQYAYRTISSFKPLSMWEYTMEQWRNRLIKITCSVNGPDDSALNSLSGIFFPVLDIYLFHLNTSSRIFVPTAGQRMNYKFFFSPAAGINALAEIEFSVIDGNREMVCKIPLRVDDQDFGDIAGFPLGSPQLNMIHISWNGRDNQSRRAGHLVDPERGPYAAQIHVITDDDSPSQK